MTAVETKEFGLGAVVSIVDGKMVAPFGEIHELIEWMAGEPVWTHQIPRVSDEARPALIEQFPGIDDVRVPDGTDSWEKAAAFLATISGRFGERLDVAPIGGADHTSIDPINELRMKAPGVEIIAVGEDEADE